MSGTINEGYFTEVAAEWNGTTPPTPVLLPIAAAKLRTARKIDGVSFDGTAGIIHYYGCGTSASTPAKTVDVTGFTLVTGAQLVVKFANGNTAASPTLTVYDNGTVVGSAKAIRYRDGAVPSGSIAANSVFLLVYDGAYWNIVGALPESVSVKYGGTFDATSGIADISSSAQTQLIQHGLGNNDTQIKITLADDLNTTPKSFGYASNVDIYYICQVAGTMFSSPDQITFAVGDWIISNGNGWSRIVMSSIPVFQKGNESNPTAPGVNGLVPGPSFNQGAQFLTGNGVWSDINAASGVRLGGFKTGFQNNERQFGVKLSSQKGYVEVPLENNLAHVGFILNTQHAIDSHCLCAVDTEGRMFSFFYKSGNNYYAETNAHFPIGAKIYYYDGVEKAAASQSGSLDATYFYTTKLINVDSEGLPHGFDGGLLSESKAIYIGVYLNDDDKSFSIVDGLDAIVTTADMTNGTHYIRIGTMNDDGTIIQIEQENPLYYFDKSGNLVDYATYLASLKKDLQKSVSSPSASGEALSFIDTVSQDTQGVISATKKSIPVFSAESDEDENDGVNGLVPAPIFDETNAFLRGDGTWAIPPTGQSYTAGGGIDITSNVIAAALKVWSTELDSVGFDSGRTTTLSPSSPNQMSAVGLYKISAMFTLSTGNTGQYAKKAQVLLQAYANGSNVPVSLVNTYVTLPQAPNGGANVPCYFEGYIYLGSGVLIPSLTIIPDGYVFSNANPENYTKGRLTAQYIGVENIVNA